MTVELLTGDALEVLPTLPAESFHAVVTDPPYGIGFMGVAWDTFTEEKGRPRSGPTSWDNVAGNHNPTNSADATRTRRSEGQRYYEWCREWAREVLRILKPGGHVVAFGGTRTVHRMASAFEDEGLEVRDLGVWLYRNGFPKSLDVSKAIDKAAGRRGEVGEPKRRPDGKLARDARGATDERDNGWGRPWRGDPEAVERNASTYVPATDEAKQWAGYGTALKPAWEPWVLARKALTGTVAANVLEHGAGALNVDAVRAPTGESTARPPGRKDGTERWRLSNREEWSEDHPLGRWPANVLTLDNDEAWRFFKSPVPHVAELVDVPKAPTKEKPWDARAGRGPRSTPTGGDIDPGSVAGNSAGAHPTVKPLALMRHLVRLVTAPGGRVLDPFMGTGTTLEAAILEGRDAVGIDVVPEYVDLARARLSKPLQGGFGV